MDLEPACRYESARHDVTAFDCGSQAQTRWLRESARMAQAARTATVYVVTPVGDGRVVRYHALAASSCAQDAAPVRLRNGAGHGPIPVILLARLGVDRSAHGQGLGAALVKDALLRAQEAAGVIGARALLIHAESPEAKAFYLHLAEFEVAPTDPLHLVLLMKDIEWITG